MKKFLALLLVLVLALALAACGSAPADTAAPADAQAPADTAAPAEAQTPETSPETPAVPDADVDAIPGGEALSGEDMLDKIDELNRKNLTAEEIAQIEADAKAEGYDAKWEADGSLTLADANSQLELNSDWPKNEFTKKVPEPKAGTPASSELTDEHCVIVMVWELDDAKEYASQLEKAGYTNDVETYEMADLGVFTYVGYDKDGLGVNVTWFNGESGIYIGEKVEEYAG